MIVRPPGKHSRECNRSHRNAPTLATATTGLALLTARRVHEIRPTAVAVVSLPAARFQDLRYGSAVNLLSADLLSTVAERMTAMIKEQRRRMLAGQNCALAHVPVLNKSGQTQSGSRLRLRANSGRDHWSRPAPTVHDDGNPLAKGGGRVVNERGSQQVRHFHTNVMHIRLNQKPKVVSRRNRNLHPACVRRGETRRPKAGQSGKEAFRANSCADD